MCAFDDFGRRLIDVYCRNKREFEIDYEYKYCEGDYDDDFGYKCLVNFFIHDHYQWMNCDLITALFPNIYELRVCGVILCGKIFDSIIAFYLNVIIKYDKYLLNMSLKKFPLNL